ncbi:serine/threonine-protein kinase [Calothrix sp. 336/3]|uniref:serine/threonine-protein kinase n=1 Tax=Calothrix sp. 336/3 TaxID=1337936 RepID=UPI0004E3BFA4|nr:serine/threonine-protein kinase [Calothrix sp. 336/3]AKG23455.1 serine/threonine protein kinase [Calothrix sp. 336/3]
MEIYCTRPGCPRPQNHFADLDDPGTIRTVQQKYCTTCGMPLILVGRYIPQKLLGRGGFGTAFLARDRHTPGMRQCVVKQFQPVGNLTPTQQQLAQDLFEREAEVLEKIGNKHEQIPNLFAFFPMIVPSLQGGKQDQFFYIVQEFIDGQNLEEELNQKKKFSEAEVREVLQAILPVLQFVHTQGIIHRDIKPSNIMRDRQGKLYLLDFGAVKQVTNSPPGAASSSTGIYSQGFAPPEQMSGGQVYPSTDLYALAVTCLMLLTGEQDIIKFFDTFSNQWQWQQQVKISSQLTEILNKMLLPAANQRYQSAQEVFDTLNQSGKVVKKPSKSAGIQPVANFSVIEILAGAAFSGFQGGLMAIALFSLSKSSLFTVVMTATIIGTLVFAQTRRWIERWDLLLIPGISLGIISFVPWLHAGFPLTKILIIATAAALISVAIAALFRLIYRLLSLLF